MILEEWKGSKMLLDGCLGCIDVDRPYNALY
jgi:hypothetical protein